jgi:hypothetical protein
MTYSAKTGQVLALRSHPFFSRPPPPAVLFFRAIVAFFCGAIVAGILATLVSGFGLSLSPEAFGLIALVTAIGVGVFYVWREHVPRR